MSEDRSTCLVPRTQRAQRKRSSLIDVELAPEQRDVVELDPETSSLILGEAGHGKTTVALHRLAHLYRTSRDALRAVVIVPTEGLVRLLVPLLRRLGTDVDVMTYDLWARRQARRAFRDLPRRESEDATAGVIRLKRDPAIRVALAELAKRAPGRIDDDLDARPSRSRAHAKRADLQHLFGDRLLLQAVARASPEITDLMIADVLDHTRVQFGKPAEVEHAHVDKKRLIAVDGRRLDEGTASGDARSVDTEDYAVLFELDRMRADRNEHAATVPPLYDVILLDEAQELAPLELALIGRSLAEGGTMIVAGDDAQQIDPSVTFTSWEDSMRELRVASYREVTLEVGYRCPPSVVDLARTIVGRASKPTPGRRSDLAPSYFSFPNESTQASWLARELEAIAESDPTGSVALLCRSALTARRLAHLLRGKAPVRWVTDGRFRSRGAQIATIDQVKGLEFDKVVVFDADPSTYPDMADARRALYVAVTRARHQLVLSSVGSFSSILRPIPPDDAGGVAPSKRKRSTVSTGG